MQKLETNSGSSDTSGGQAVTPFKAQPQRPINDAKGSIGTSKDILHKPDIVVQPPSQDVTIDDPVKPSRTFDMSVLEALPREFREELENEYRHRSTSPFVSGLGSPVTNNASHQMTAAAAVPVQPLNNRNIIQSVGPSVFPRKPKSETDYMRIDSWCHVVEPPSYLRTKAKGSPPEPLLSGRFSRLPKPNFHLVSSLIVHLIPKRDIFNLLS